jgi:uncharacterized membrane protein
MHDATRPTNELSLGPRSSKAVDNTDWLKTVAIILVAVDHFGFFFMEDDAWWSAVGRLAAPSFFFLIGYAQTRTVPLHWIWLAAVLTLLDSWNHHWRWVAPNILFSLALIRLARPYAQELLQRHGWTALAVLVCAMLVALPVTGKIVDYGAEGWLWGLFGLCQRIYVDAGSAADGDGAAQTPVASARARTRNAGAMRLAACFLATLAYVWGEQREYRFAPLQLAAFILGIGALSLALCRFHRAASLVQPPKDLAGILRFIGRHTLEIYAIQLAGSEILIKLVPDLAP